MIEITAIGDANIDLITSKLEDFPERDSQKIISSLEISTGGCASNFAKALSKLGLKTRLIAKVGRDEWGKRIRRELEREGVKVNFSLGKKTGLTLALNFSDASRSFITFPGANSEFSFRDINFKQIKGKYLHIASFFLQGLREKTLKLLRYAHSQSMITSFDTGWDPEGWSQEDVNLVKETLSEVDIFFPNLREGQAITEKNTPKEICKNLLSLGPKIIALKLGKEGCFIYSQKESFFLPPLKIKARDTTGAGDVFDAAFIYGDYQQWKLRKIGIFANYAAALSTRGYGSNCYPTLREIKNLTQQ